MPLLFCSVLGAHATIPQMWQDGMQSMRSKYNAQRKETIGSSRALRSGYYFILVPLAIYTKASPIHFVFLQSLLQFISPISPVMDISNFGGNTSQQPHNSAGPRVNATDWALTGLAAFFVALRIGCKIKGHRSLWWDDYVLIASFVS